MLALFKTLRPAQWTKNFFVFAGIIFSLRFFELPLLLKVGYAFVIFCALSSAIYIINDLKDIERDRRHPQKKFRPIANQQVSIPVVLILALGLMLLAGGAAFKLDVLFGWVAVAYIILMLLYTFLLKEMVILDVFSIAAGFVLRAIAGVVVIDVELSPWLIICTILLALFIALGKRRHELVTLTEASCHRGILEEYTPQLLDQLISVTAGATVVAYALYTLWPETVTKFGTRNLVYSVPFVLYGIFRYLYLIYKKEQGGRPEKILLTDVPLIVDIGLWVITLIMIVYWRR
ncbi:MAG: decaprenyl-phosphate phosphoribosyltransferase [Candidatus Margulisbacteria bacterium]|nr:decaprenyl-phosphate phosphoribosyltransferase [Candidatus Margulisiibacteriota bacterium]